MAIGPVARHGLHDEHQKTGDSGNNPHLGQAEPHLVDKHGKQGAHKRAVEISAEVNQAKGYKNFPICF